MYVCMYVCMYVYADYRKVTGKYSVNYGKELMLLHVCLVSISKLEKQCRAIETVEQEYRLKYIVQYTPMNVKLFVECNIHLARRFHERILEPYGQVTKSEINQNDVKAAY